MYLVLALSPFQSKGIFWYIIHQMTKPKKEQWEKYKMDEIFIIRNIQIQKCKKIQMSNPNAIDIFAVSNPWCIKTKKTLKPNFRSQFAFADSLLRTTSSFPNPVNYHKELVQLSGLKICSFWADFHLCYGEAPKNRLKKGAFGQEKHEPL
jgi:hypothetical protein